MSLVGGDTSRRAPDITDLLVEVARNGPAFAERMDALKKAQADADAAVARYTKTQDIEALLLEASSKSTKASKLVSDADDMASSIKQSAQAEVASMMQSAQMELTKLSEERDFLRADCANLRTEAARIRQEAEQIMDQATSASKGLKAEADEIYKSAQKDKATASELRAKAEVLLLAARQKVEALRAAWGD